MPPELSARCHFVDANRAFDEAPDLAHALVDDLKRALQRQRDARPWWNWVAIPTQTRRYQASCGSRAAKWSQPRGATGSRWAPCSSQTPAPASQRPMRRKPGTGEGAVTTRA